MSTLHNPVTRCWGGYVVRQISYAKQTGIMSCHMYGQKGWGGEVFGDFSLLHCEIGYLFQQLIGEVDCCMSGHTRTNI